MKLQLTKAHTIENSNNLYFSHPIRAQFVSTSKAPYRNLRTLFHKLFKTHGKQDSIINEAPERNSHETISETIEQKATSIEENTIETRSLQDLETCANAARQSEAGGQYEWMEQPDEEK